MMSKAKVDLNLLSNVVLHTEDGQALKMASLWRNRPAVLIFLRHFSCVACRAHVAQVWQHRKALEQGGAKICFIGNGSYHEIIKFKKELNIESSMVFTDPSRRSYEATGMRRGMMPALGPKAVANVVRLLSEGHRQKVYNREAGDLWQLGGVLVVNPGDVIRYHYISEVTGDFPEPGEIANPPQAPVHTPPAADFSLR